MNLVEFSLVFGDRNACAVEDDESCTRCTLINGTNESTLHFILVLILQQRTLSIVSLFWTIVEVQLFPLFVLHMLVHMLFGELEILGGFGVSVKTLKVQIEWVAHLPKCVESREKREEREREREREKRGIKRDRFYCPPGFKEGNDGGGKRTTRWRCWDTGTSSRGRKVERDVSEKWPSIKG